MQMIPVHTEEGDKVQRALLGQTCARCSSSHAIGGPLKCVNPNSRFYQEYVPTDGFCPLWTESCFV